MNGHFKISPEIRVYTRSSAKLIRTVYRLPLTSWRSAWSRVRIFWNYKHLHFKNTLKLYLFDPWKPAIWSWTSQYFSSKGANLKGAHSAGTTGSSYDIIDSLGMVKFEALWSLLLVAIRGPFFKIEKLNSIEIREIDLYLFIQMIINNIHDRVCYVRTVYQDTLIVQTVW